MRSFYHISESESPNPLQGAFNCKLPLLSASLFSLSCGGQVSCVQSLLVNCLQFQWSNLTWIWLIGNFIALIDLKSNKRIRISRDRINLIKVFIHASSIQELAYLSIDLSINLLQAVADIWGAYSSPWTPGPLFEMKQKVRVPPFSFVSPPLASLFQPMPHQQFSLYVLTLAGKCEHSLCSAITVGAANISNILDTNSRCHGKPETFQVTLCWKQTN